MVKHVILWTLKNEYSKEEKEETQSEHDISDKRTKNPLPVNGTRAKAHAVNNAAANRPHQQETMPDFQLAGLRRKARRIPENAASQQQRHQ